MPNRVGRLLSFTHCSASYQFIQRPSWKNIEKNLLWQEGFYSHNETMTLSLYEMTSHVLHTWCHYFSVPILLECRIFIYANKFYFVLVNNLKIDLNVLEYNNNEGIQIKNRLGDKVGVPTQPWRSLNKPTFFCSFFDFFITKFLTFTPKHKNALKFQYLST